ncbi:MAG: sugar transferase [Candidatus Nomurabacteria bacterium]|jgi:exopolysaccharide biosynthesis polyprenyl glycosylphosphotransferase|nr:sugar transferase [Candidatus Nomurabacteria bacterium]
MPAKNNRLFSLLLVVLDLAVLTVAFVLAYVARVSYDPRPLLNQMYAGEYLLSLLAIVPLWVIVFACLGLYSPINYDRRLVSWGKIFLGCFIGILLVIGWEYIGNESIFPARLVAVYAFLGAFVLIVLERETTRFIRSLSFQHGHGINRVLLIGATSINYDIIKSLSCDQKHGYKVVAVAGPKKFVPDSCDLKRYTTIDEALRHLKKDRISTVIQTSFYEEQKKNQQILAASQAAHINYCFIPGEPEFYSGKNEIDIFLDYPIIKIYQTPLVGWGSFFKRIFDLLVLLVFAPIWIPIFVLVVLAQLVFNPGPVFFKQKRLGRYKKPFNCYKFRSMNPKYSGKNVGDAVAIFKSMGRDDLVAEYTRDHKVKHDPRITRFGHILRMTSLDELAQLVNVIRGEMSLVGPRPIMPDELGEFKGRGALLLSIKPGLTGLASVSGRSKLSFDRRVDLELYYTQSWSFWLDIKILIKTIRVVFSRNGSA